MMPCSEQNLIVHQQIHAFGGFCEFGTEVNNSSLGQDPKSQPSYPNLEHQGHYICLIGCTFKVAVASANAITMIREHYV